MNAPRNGFAACSGCSLCLLVCPVWRRTRDPRMTPEGRAKALQSGAAPADVAASVEACTLCAACVPVCPEEIDLIGMTLGLRRQLLGPARGQELREQMDRRTRAQSPPSSGSGALLLPGSALVASPAVLARVQALLGASLCGDDGADIALALEAGAEVPAGRLERFLAPLRRTGRIYVEDGLWLSPLRAWLPGTRLAGVGEALSGLDAVRRGLRTNDLYVIEPRAYHGDYQRLVKHYDSLRAARGCAFNLDLQRIAIPAATHNLPQRLGTRAIDDSVQVEWILKGRNVARIVVESMQDRIAFEQMANLPVVHLSELAEHGTQ